MSDAAFKNAFRHFLYDYWGAFHEVLEAQSITPQRLAESLFDDLLIAHHAFEREYTGAARDAVHELRALWAEVDCRRVEKGDVPLTHEEVVRARQLFQDIYDDLLSQGQQNPAATTEILKFAPHSTPAQPLRADAAR
jgi:hypothetical protein